MPSAFPNHKPRRSLPDQRVREQDKARHARRYMPLNGAQWRAIRKAQLERFPLCVDCGDVATEADHIEGDTSLNIIGVDLASRCKSCHSRKTAAENGSFGRPKKIASNRGNTHRPPSLAHATAKLESP